jgi:hypothetical protein
MPYDWDEYLIFAADLEGKCGDFPNSGFNCKKDTFQRNIISRRYYSAFHYAKKYVEQHLGYELPRERVHDEVRNWFLNNPPRHVFDDLRDFSKWRNWCDYDVDVNDLDGLIVKSRKYAGRIMHAF